ncbi:MAG: hypothetical protein RJA44_168 [Pseudomonadota bacterium]|jgi:methyl-accepting chemotaxis protein
MQWWFDLSIRSRLVAGFLLPLAALMSFNVWLWFEMGQVREQAVRVQQSHVRHALIARDLEVEVVQVQQFLSDISATRGHDGLDDGLRQAAANRDRFLASLQQLEDNTGQRNDELRRRFETYYQQGRLMAQAYVEHGPEGGNPLMPGFDAASEALQQSLKPLVEAAVEQLQQASDRTARLADQGRHAAALIGLLLALVQIGIVLWIARQITQPLRQAVTVARAVAAGDLTQQPSWPHRDETGQLLGALGDMVLHLRQMIVRVRDGAKQVAGASAEIAQGNGDLSQRTENQAAHLQRTAASMDQIAHGMVEHGGRSEIARRLAADAAQNASAGGAAVQQMVSTMSEIQQSSQRIADIIQVIDSIAFQTNILALNAAVEAARAGEHGRGFAVVAAEVRNLAQRSHAASDEIRGLISSSVQTIVAGNQLASRTGASIAAVVEQVRQVADLIGEMTAVQAQENHDIGAISHVVAEMDTATQQNAALVEQIAATAVSLSQQAVQLDGAVAAFRLETA